MHRRIRFILTFAFILSWIGSSCSSNSGLGQLETQVATPGSSQEIAQRIYPSRIVPTTMMLDLPTIYPLTTTQATGSILPTEQLTTTQSSTTIGELVPLTPTLTPDGAQIENTPIGIAVKNTADVTFLNSRLRENDIVYLKIVSANGFNLEPLQKTIIGRRMVILASQDIAYKTDIFEQAKLIGVEIIGFNLEGKLSKDELVSQQGSLSRDVHAHGFLFMFGPTVVALDSYYKEFSQYADFLVIQSQKFQTDTNYVSVVRDLIDRIRGENPQIKIWVQVSVNPPGNRTIDPELVLQNILDIRQYCDGIFIYYSPEQWGDAQEIINQLR